MFTLAAALQQAQAAAAAQSATAGLSASVLQEAHALFAQVPRPEPGQDVSNAALLGALHTLATAFGLLTRSLAPQPQPALAQVARLRQNVQRVVSTTGAAKSANPLASTPSLRNRASKRRQSGTAAPAAPGAAAVPPFAVDESLTQSLRLSSPPPAASVAASRDSSVSILSRLTSPRQQVTFREAPQQLPGQLDAARSTPDPVTAAAGVFLARRIRAKPKEPEPAQVMTVSIPSNDSIVDLESEQLDDGIEVIECSDHTVPVKSVSSAAAREPEALNSEPEDDDHKGASAGASADDAEGDAIPPSRLEAVRAYVRTLVDADVSFDKISVDLIFFVISLVAVLVSIMLLCVGTLPRYHDGTPPILTGLEIACVAFFTLEIALKLFSAESLRSLCNVVMLVDVISVVPFYLALIVEAAGADRGRLHALTFLRAFRLFRVVRVLRLGQYSESMRTLGETLFRSMEAFTMLGFCVGTTVVLFSSAMFLSESSTLEWDPTLRKLVLPDGTPSPYQSIPHSFWWCIVTLTTVGYGDAVPSTSLGKMIAGCTALCGVVVLAFPVMILSINFAAVRAEHEAQMQIKAQQEAIMEINALVESAKEPDH